MTQNLSIDTNLQFNLPSCSRTTPWEKPWGDPDYKYLARTKRLKHLFKRKLKETEDEMKKQTEKRK